MDDAALVDVGDGLGHLPHHGDGQRRRQGPEAADALVEGGSFDELEYEARAAVVFEVLEEPGDARMVELGLDAGLVAETVRRAAPDGARAEDFERDHVAALEMDGTVDLTHAARPDEVHQAVVTDGLTAEFGHDSSPLDAALPRPAGPGVRLSIRARSLRLAAQRRVPEPIRPEAGDTLSARLVHHCGRSH